MDFNQRKDNPGGGNSVFAGILPAAAPPAPPSAPLPVEPRRGPSSDEALTAVKFKIEAMEKTLLAQIEKKLDERAGQGAGLSPTSPVPAILLQKIEELEGRIKDYQERSTISAGQMKSIEESKIGARREIEDLLKAVREQQKFSELDRQMHEQLQKSWLRVEDLEKKLMDIFSSTARPGAQGKLSLDSDVVQKAVESAVASKMGALTSAVEERLSTLSARLAAEISAQAQARTAPDRFEERLFAFKEEMRETYAVAAAAGLRENRTALLDEFTSRLRTALRDESSLVEKYSREMVAIVRDRQDALSKNISTQMDGVVMRAEADAQRARDLSAKLEENLAAFSAGVSEKIMEAQKQGTEKIKAVCGLAGSSLGGLDAALSSVTRLNERLLSLEQDTRGVIKEMESVNLEAVLGVSGVLVRKNYAAMKESLDRISEEGKYILEAREKIASALKAAGSDAAAG